LRPLPIQQPKRLSTGHAKPPFSSNRIPGASGVYFSSKNGDKEAKAADAPILGPTKIEFVINLEDREGAGPDYPVSSFSLPPIGDRIALRDFRNGSSSTVVHDRR
jgi:hypothetical protein